METKHIINNTGERGSALIVTLVILVALTGAVIMGALSSSFDMTLAGNDKCINLLRVNAESAALTATQRLDNLIALVETRDDKVASKKRVDEQLALQIPDEWDSKKRYSWLHRGENGCVNLESKDGKDGPYHNGDINWDGDNDDDITDSFDRARLYSQYYLMNDVGPTGADNWKTRSGGGIGLFSSGTCEVLTDDSTGNAVPNIENTQYMILQYKHSNLRMESGISYEDRDYLVSGAAEGCNGKYMIQIGFRRTVQVINPNDVKGSGL